MASEETILSLAPVTPAHKFAWRAFRGFVYGSPESPEQHNSNVGIGKENARPPSPQKKVSLDLPPPAQLSPQKRKRDASATAPQVSPTKSILRTPGGAPTPRAKSLRDVNVKFKSVSPEAVVQRNVSAPVVVPVVTAAKKVDVVALEREVDDLWEEMERSVEGVRNDASREKKLAAPAKVKKNLRSTATTTVAQTAAQDPEREAYARRTEKEFRQILRHHKKMKDYARKMDEQNVVLKEMVAELRAENKRLKEKLEKKEAKRDVQPNDVGTSHEDSLRGRKERPEEPAQQEKTATATALSRTEAFKRSLRGTESLPEEVAHALAHRPRQTAESLRDRNSTSKRRQRPSISVLEDLKAPEARRHDDDEIIRTTESARAGLGPAPQPRSPSPLTRTTSSVRSKNEPKAKPRNPQAISITLLAEQLEPTPAPAPPPSRERTKPASSSSSSSATIRVSAQRSATALASSTAPSPPQRSTTAPAAVSNLPPDRAAAARLRLEQKREKARLGIVGNGTSLASAGMMGGGVEGKSAGRERSSVLGREKEREESVLDWAGL